MLLLICLAALVTANGAVTLTSPLTQPQFSWVTELNQSDLGLPWYGVSQWEVEVCTQGLTSSYGADPAANNIVEVSLNTPIYRDTVTVLAKKSPYDSGTGPPGMYYEVGWYMQPYEGTYDVEVILYNAAGINHTLVSNTASSSRASDGYYAIPLPCDPDIYTCIPLTGELRQVRLRWRHTLTNHTGDWQYLLSGFIDVNST